MYFPAQVLQPSIYKHAGSQIGHVPGFLERPRTLGNLIDWTHYSLDCILVLQFITWTRELLCLPWMWWFGSGCSADLLEPSICCSQPSALGTRTYVVPSSPVFPKSGSCLNTTELMPLSWYTYWLCLNTY